MKDVRAYEALDPGALGRRHAIVLGKHSGLSAIRAVCGDLGLDPEAEAQTLVEVKRSALRAKRAVPTDEARRMASSIQQRLDQRARARQCL